VSQRVREAIQLALELHAGQTRKGGAAPYVFHPLAVAGLVADAGADEDTIVAAILHDAVEDAGGPATRERIARQFGERVAGFVDACSDTDQTDKPPWRQRKEAFVARMRSAAPEVRAIVAADKLHNARSLTRALRAQGNALWGNFRGGRDGSLWYYAAVTEALGDGWQHPLLEELREVVAVLTRTAG
jgi:GTP pyrophosphokinase